MEDIKLIDFSDWQPYEGLAAGSGRSEKEWLISPDGQIGLLKYPKTDPKTNSVTTEHISEHLAAQIGRLIEVNTAIIDLGHRNDRIGSMSYLVNEDQEALIEGIVFLSGLYPKYDADKMFDEDSGVYYSIEMIEKVAEQLHTGKWIEMLLFDALIGNADRHQSNWAMLLKLERLKKTDNRQMQLNFKMRWCPLYDNGSSLCCYVNEESLDKFFGKDPGPFRSLVDTQSKSIVRINGISKKRPTHKEVLQYLLGQYPPAKEIAARFVQKLTANEIDKLLAKYPPDILSEKRNQLIRLYLNEKRNIFADAINERLSI